MFILEILAITWLVDLIVLHFLLQSDSSNVVMHSGNPLTSDQVKGNSNRKHPLLTNRVDMEPERRVRKHQPNFSSLLHPWLQSVP